DIAERRKPQDGRITLNAQAAGRMLDVRVATLPTVEGEAVTMRLLDKSREVPTLAALGLSEAMQTQMTGILSRPTGALLVTGPTPRTQAVPALLRGVPADSRRAESATG